jgi:hypothetical protein
MKTPAIIKKGRQQPQAKGGETVKQKIKNIKD